MAIAFEKLQYFKNNTQNGWAAKQIFWLKKFLQNVGQPAVCLEFENWSKQKVCKQNGKQR